MKQLIDFIARNLADEPDEVDVRETDRGRRLQLRVADADLGKMIGRRGRTANSMRTLLQIAAGRRVDLDIDSHSEAAEREGSRDRARAERESVPSDAESERELE